MHLILGVGCPSCDGYYRHYVADLPQNNKSPLTADIQARRASLMRAIEKRDYVFHGSIQAEVDRHFESKWTQEIQSLTKELKQHQNKLFAAKMKRTRLMDANRDLESKLADNVSRAATRPCDDDAPPRKRICRRQPSPDYITVPSSPSVVALSPGRIPDQGDEGL
jgi:hypothetical protein